MLGGNTRLGAYTLLGGYALLGGYTLLAGYTRLGGCTLLGGYAPLQPPWPPWRSCLTVTVTIAQRTATPVHAK